MHLRILFSILFQVAVLTPVLAQEIVLSAEVMSKKVGVQDPFELRISAQNVSNLERVILPNTKDFQILGGPSVSTNVTISNGNYNSSVEYTYVLKANRSGSLVFPSSIVRYKGKEYKTNPLTMEVTEGSLANRNARARQRPPSGRNPFEDFFSDEDPFEEVFRQQQQLLNQLQQRMQGGRPLVPPSIPNPRQMPQQPIEKEDIAKNIFIKVDVDKTAVMKGEQVTASYKLYTRLPMEVNLTKLPSLNGFWSQDFKIPNPPKPYRDILNGREYQVFEIKRTALFPTQTGTLTLDPAEAEGTVRVMKSNRKGNSGIDDDESSLQSMLGSLLMSDPDFEDGVFGYYDFEEVPVKLRSTPINIAVEDVPTERPISFKGAIGKYQLESKLSKAELTTDDVVELTLRVSGTGNIKLIEAPEIKSMSGLEPLDVKELDSITNTDNIIAGYKTFTYTFSPSMVGSHSIPSASFSYYDTEEKLFKTLTTPSYTIQVRPGKETDNDKLPKDIHDIESDAIVLKKAAPLSLPSSPLFWSGFGLPMLAYIGFAFFKKKENDLKGDTVLFKNKKASKVALQRLSTAEKYLKQTNQAAFYEETSKAVWLYISDKLNIPLSRLNKEVALDRLQTVKVPDELEKEVFRITDECQYALYSPDRGALQMHQTYQDTFKLIGKLEEYLG